MKDIYMDFKKCEEVENSLKDCADTIMSENTKLSSYLEQLENNWKGIAATKFSNKIQESITEFKNYQQTLSDDVDILSGCRKAYKSFEEDFLSKNV